jgi:hypothetical protein
MTMAFKVKGMYYVSISYKLPLCCDEVEKLPLRSGAPNLVRMALQIEKIGNASNFNTRLNVSLPQNCDKPFHGLKPKFNLSLNCDNLLLSTFITITTSNQESLEAVGE